MKNVAVIGDGPDAIVAARSLKHGGFAPAIYERGRQVGGDWIADALLRDVRPSMGTDSSRLMTAHSDQSSDPRTCAYQANQGILAHLQRCAQRFELAWCARFETRVERIGRAVGGAYLTLRFTGADGVSRSTAAALDD